MRIEKEYRCDMGKNEFAVVCYPEKTMPAYYSKMLENPDMAHVLNYRRDESNGRLRLLFDTEELCRLDSFYDEKKPGFEQLNRLFDSLLSTLEKAGAYLLDEQDFLIGADSLFVDRENNIFLCCVPGYERPLKEQFAALFEYLMDKIDYRDRHAVITVYEMYRRSRESICSFSDMRAVLERKYEAESVEEIAADASLKDDSAVRSCTEANGRQEAARTSGFDRRATLPDISRNRSEQENKSAERYSPLSSKANRQKRGLFAALKAGLTSEQEGKKTEYEAALSVPSVTATTLLYRPVEQAEFVMRAEDGKETIRLDKFPFYIGKAGANLNVELAYPQISRLHAKLLLNNEKKVVLEDLNSLNGTYLNGMRLEKGQKAELTPGDRISLANRVYIFERNDV